MANNKNSFVLYTDLIHTVSKLPDEKAGQLFKHILEYVNDNDPQTDDLILQISFEPIKQQLKRDLRKYETYIEKQKANGSKGGRPKAKETQKTQAFISKPKKADSVNVSVNDNDNVNDINIPTQKVFLDYALEKKSNVDEESVKLKYDAWVVNGWKDGNGNKIKNWKTKLLNTLPHLKENLQKKKDPYAIDDSMSSNPDRMKW